MKYSRIATFFMQRFRKGRLQFFFSTFPPSEYRTVLDVGGTPQIWRMLDASYEVTLLNEDRRELQAQDLDTSLVGDGRSLQFADNSFDIAFSNSVIEHVGDWEDMQRFASELRRVGKSFYCQTPNKWFPVEPHLGTLFLHWWPQLLRQFFLVRYFTLWGLMNRPGRKQVARSLAGIRHLTRGDLERLFPGATIIPERFLLLSKSYVVMHRYHQAEMAHWQQPAAQGKAGGG
jgi:SAM-dependent methyltransferase